MKKAFLITGSGRSGTQNLVKFIKKFSRWDVEHERNFNQILKLGVLNFYNCDDTDQKEIIYEEYKKQIYKPQSSHTFVDVSNALIWCINDVDKLFENNQNIMVIRNGYKVISSFYYKFKSMMYPDEQILKARDDFLSGNFKHPLDKTFWRPLPNCSDFYSNYKDHLRFATICWYWSETINIYEKNIDLFNGNFFKFEEIVSGVKLEKFCKILGIPVTNESEAATFFFRPTNVAKPENFKMNIDQIGIFSEICSKHMNKYYGSVNEYYDVSY